MSAMKPAAVGVPCRRGLCAQAARQILEGNPLAEPPPDMEHVQDSTAEKERRDVGDVIELGARHADDPIRQAQCIVTLAARAEPDCRQWVRPEAEE